MIWRSRFSAAGGLTRVAVAPGSFGDWLRHLPLLPPGAPVHLFDGRLKPRQDVHAAVVDLDVGTRDLQQCADAVMRLRAEYLFASGAAIAFHPDPGKPRAIAWPSGENGDGDRRRFGNISCACSPTPAPPRSRPSSSRRASRSARWYSSSLRYSVLRSRPSRCAARVLLPPSACSTRSDVLALELRQGQPAGQRAGQHVRRAALAHLRRKIVGADLIALGQRDRALDHVLQLAHVAGPG